MYILAFLCMLANQIMCNNYTIGHTLANNMSIKYPNSIAKCLHRNMIFNTLIHERSHSFYSIPKVHNIKREESIVL